jgi:lipid A 3-O-deacylase
MRISEAMQKITLILAAGLLISAGSPAQRIDNTASYRNVAGEKYFRLHYDNDFETKTDYYYTQGYCLEFVHPVLKKNPVIRLLPNLKNSNIKTGLAFEHYGFTPTSIKSDEILRNDRPFAGVIILKSFSVSIDSIRRQRLVSVLSLGMIGPAAFAGKMQAAIHRRTGDPEPRGWQFQIRNDAVVNYELAHEKELIHYASIISIHTSARIRLGTLSDKAETGFIFLLGRYSSPFRSAEKKRNFQLYAYSHPYVSFVGYDAALQGGLLNRSSPYTITGNQINRITFQNNYGLVLGFRKLYMEYYRTYISKEFKTGREHGWGGIKIGLAL